MGFFQRKVEIPGWVRPPQDTWPRTHHRRGMPVRGFPVGVRRRIALVGEGPGYDESTYGYPFIGASGQEVDRHLARVGLHRGLCLVTNLSWQVPSEAQKKNGQLGSMNPHLLAELDAADPEIVMTLGRHSTRYFLGDVDVEATHGILHRVRICRCCGKIWQPNGHR